MCVAVCRVRLPLVVNEALQMLQLNAFTPAAEKTALHYLTDTSTQTQTDVRHKSGKQRQLLYCALQVLGA
jgi:hypothetical protein